MLRGGFLSPRGFRSEVARPGRVSWAVTASSLQRLLLPRININDTVALSPPPSDGLSAPGLQTVFLV